MRRKLLPAFALLVLTSGASKALAQEEVHGYEALYGTFIDYSGSSEKRDGYSAAAYLEIGDGLVHSLKLAYAYTFINYKGKSDLNQNDFTLLYSNYYGILKNHIFTIGGHYIDSDDELTDGGFILIFDGTHVSHPERFSWSAGLELAYSDYSSGADFSVFQLSPHATFKLYSAAEGDLYLNLKGYGIFISDEDKAKASDDSYYSLEASITYKASNYDITVSGWGGEQMFAVKGGGFIVYNLQEKYEGGGSLEVGYYPMKNLRISCALNFNTYKEIASGEDVDQTAITLSAGYRF